MDKYKFGDRVVRPATKRSGRIDVVSKVFYDFYMVIWDDRTEPQSQWMQGYELTV
jgi:hypothetical protein